jgi:hypothetical protein
MVKQIDFSAQNKVLRFEINENEWCSLTVMNESDEVFIGAETFSYVKKRLGRALFDISKLEISGEINKKNVHWILTLNEKHYALYGARHNKVFSLFIENQNGELIEILTLSDGDRENWINLLKGYFET